MGWLKPRNEHTSPEGLKLIDNRSKAAMEKHEHYTVSSNLEGKRRADAINRNPRIKERNDDFREKKFEVMRQAKALGDEYDGETMKAYKHRRTVTKKIKRKSTSDEEIEA